VGEGAARVLSRAGRRSAGLGSDGGARTHTHAVGVRAYGAVCVPQTKRGGVGDGVICSVVVHTRWFDGAKVVFFFVAIRSEMEVSASSQTHWCSSEVPLDAARCRYSVHWREGGSARCGGGSFPPVSAWRRLPPPCR